MDKDRPKLSNIQEIKDWINSQEWYQKIHLSNGLITPGKYDTQKRLHFFKKLELKGKTFLDVGCNSGAYCLWAKKEGAKRVVGVDINSKRLEQAKTLAIIEGLDIEFKQLGIHKIKNLGKFDIVFCIAVLTEVENILGAISSIKSIINERAFIELALAKPLLYISKSKHWVQGLKDIGPKSIFELRRTNAGWMVCPGIDALKTIFGEQFRLKALGTSLRYDLLEICKLKNI